MTNDENLKGVRGVVGNADDHYLTYTGCDAATLIESKPIEIKPKAFEPLPSELLAAMSDKINAAMSNLRRETTAMLYSGDVKITTCTPEEAARYKKEQRIANLKRLALEPFRRIAGAFRTLTHGDCGRCEDSGDPWYD